MTEAPAPEETLHIDLRKPGLAAFLAWLWPGAGHLYQRRYAKGLLFMVCILGTYFFGLGISGGRAVYASFASQDFRWQYVCQLGVGAPALPAIVQNRLVSSGREPLLPICYRYGPGYPHIEAGRHAYDVVSPEALAKLKPEQIKQLVEAELLIVDGFMAPPHPPVLENDVDALTSWHEKPLQFEMGTLFAMVAGLLNVLAIYDAYAGPVIATPEDEADKPTPDEGDGEKKGAE